MFQIRPEQLPVFDPQTEDDVLPRVRNLMRIEYPHLVEEVPEDQLDQLIRLGFRRARALGFDESSTLIRFAVLMFICAPNFDEHPRVRAVLTDRTLTQEQRLDALLQRTTDQDWQEVRERYDAAAWGDLPELG